MEPGGQNEMLRFFLRRERLDRLFRSEVSAGVVEPDADGRLSFASENLPKVAWPVTGFRLTLESGNGSRASILEPPPPPATATQ